MLYYETERLILREWKDSDIKPYVALNLDPHVLRFFPSVYTEKESIADIEEFKQHFKTYGYSIYACELKLHKQFIGFEKFDLPEIVSFTPKINKPSERVMQKIGMHYDKNDEFYHYKLTNEHPLCLHVLYRISKQNWLRSTG